MKKFLNIALLLFLLIANLSACGNAASTSTSVKKVSEETVLEKNSDSYSDAAPVAISAMTAKTASDNSDMTMESDQKISDGLTMQDGTDDLKTSGTRRKLIRNVSLDVETKDYDNFLHNLQQQVSTMGGYVESSELHGTKNLEQHNRSASFTFRLPKASVDDFLNFTEGNANLLHKYENTRDITLQYADTEGRKKALQIEYDRLLELLAKAESVEAIITLESRLSDLRYQLDSFESDLRRYDNEVDYSSISMNIKECRVLTPQKQDSFWSKVSSGIAENLNNLSLCFIDFLIWLFSTLPVLAIPALVIYFLLRLILKIRKNRKMRKDAIKKGTPVKDSIPKETITPDSPKQE